MKLLFIIVLSTLTMLFSSCKKDKIVDNTTYDYSHLSGDFLCDVDVHMSGTLSSFEPYHFYSDKVISTSVTGSVLHFQGIDFPIESESQTVFEYSDANSSATLTFTNNFNDIEVHFEQPSVSGFGPNYYDNYDGTRTSLPVTTIPHNSIADIEGQYQMDILKRNTTTGLDTAYSEIITVSFNPSNGALNFGPDYLHPGAFHTYTRQTKINVFNINTNSLIWRNDSLYISQENTNSSNLDTISSYNYTGVHL